MAVKLPTNPTNPILAKGTLPSSLGLYMVIPGY